MRLPEKLRVMHVANSGLTDEGTESVGALQAVDDGCLRTLQRGMSSSRRAEIAGSKNEAQRSLAVMSSPLRPKTGETWWLAQAFRSASVCHARSITSIFLGVLENDIGCLESGLSLRITPGMF
jgi:hypothetical protein